MDGRINWKTLGCSSNRVCVCTYSQPTSLPFPVKSSFATLFTALSVRVFIKEKEISHLNLNDFFHAKCHAIFLISLTEQHPFFVVPFFGNERVFFLIGIFPKHIFLKKLCTRWRSFFPLTIMKTSIITFVIFILTFMNSWHLKGPKTSRLVIIMVALNFLHECILMLTQNNFCIENTLVY